MRYMVSPSEESPFLFDQRPIPDWFPTIGELTDLVQMWNAFRNAEDDLAQAQEGSAADRAQIFVSMSRECWNQYSTFLFDALRSRYLAWREQQHKAEAAEMESHPERFGAGWVYVLKADGYPLYKIGKTSRLPDDRVAQFSPKLPFESGLVLNIPTDNCSALERELHQLLAPKRRNGEWFELSEDDLGAIKAHVATEETA